MINKNKILIIESNRTITTLKNLISMSNFSNFILKKNGKILMIQIKNLYKLVIRKKMMRHTLLERKRKKAVVSTKTKTSIYKILN